MRDTNMHSFKQCVPTEGAAMYSRLVKCSLTAVTEMTHSGDNFTSVKVRAKGWRLGVRNLKESQDYLLICRLLVKSLKISWPYWTKDHSYLMVLHPAGPEIHI